MSLLKVSDNYSAYIVGNFNSTAETITVDVAPVKTTGYLTIFDLNGNQFEKIKYTGVDGLNLTGCIRGLSFDDNSDTPVEGNAQDLKNGMVIKMTVTQHYINPLVDVVNGTNAFEGVPKNPSTRTISDNRHLTDKEYVDGIATGGILSMLVSIDSGLNININSGNYILNGTVETYAGVASEPLTDDETNYIQLVDGVLTINTTGFVDDAIPLATAICADGEITSLVDSRPFYTGVDLKDDSGLGRDSDGLFIDLGTDSGLEFSEDGLEVKTKTDGGLVKDSDGLSVDTGVTEGKIVKLISGGKLPAVDGSNLTNIADYSVNNIGAGGNTVKQWHNFMIPFTESSAGSPSYWTETVFTGTSYANNYIPTAGNNASLITSEASIFYRGFNGGSGNPIPTTFADNFIVEFYLQIRDQGTNAEAGWGFVETTAPFVDYDDASVEAVCFTTDGTNLYAHTSNGGGGTDHTETLISGVTVTDKNNYRIEYTAGSDAKFYVNGILKATITTTLPTAANTKFGFGHKSSNYNVSYVSIPYFSVEV